MELSVRPATIQEIQPWREMHRLEMNCQITHDSIHYREGWTREYALLLNSAIVGYGSVAQAGPWAQTHTAYEFFLVPHQRCHAFALFSRFLDASKAAAIEVQTRETLLTTMFHSLVYPVLNEKIVFRDLMTTSLAAPGATFRLAQPGEAVQVQADLKDEQREWVIEYEGVPAAIGGILFHYNRPYGDLYMHVAERFRRRGLGSYLVQELKRVCYEIGSVPAARCSPNNAASRQTLQKAGFVPYCNILSGPIDPKRRETL